MTSQAKLVLNDKDFLKQLDQKRDREVFARIIALTFDEEPIERIEGLVTTGTVNIDGSSAVRRTCSLSLVATNLDINNYYWGLKSKFKLEIGLKNTIGEPYEDLDIIWFPQGTYAITAFNTTYNASGYSVSISGKDKMCFLNGDLGGSLTASIDFGTEEYYDKATNTTTYTQVPIETIIREGVHTYAKEPYYNIIINDLDEASVELLEYKGDTPLYLLRERNTTQFVNFTDNSNAEINFVENPLSGYFALQDLEDKGGRYDSRVELETSIAYTQGTPVKFNGSDKEYTVAKLEYGQTAGYRYTDLTYAGDLVSSIGESFTSILDKIVAMLGNYEYFYDLDGRFVFQKKKTYTQTSWNNIIKVGDDEYADSAVYSSSSSYQFEDSSLITSFQNTPNLSNLKNDYSVWGVRESVSGAEIPVHYRYAIDQKPTHYKSLDGINYYSNEYDSELPANTEQFDWRELIYQMALDYYKYHEQDDYEYRLKTANPGTCYNGSTGYEQYYTDMQGFWRQLYDPNPDVSYAEYDGGVKEVSFKAIDKDGKNINLRIKGGYQKMENAPTPEEYEDVWALIYCNGRYELHPWIDAIQLPNYLIEIPEGEDDYTDESSRYYRTGPNGKYVQLQSTNIKSRMIKSEIYYWDDNNSKPPEEVPDEEGATKPKWIMKSSLANNANGYIKGFYKYVNDNVYRAILPKKEEEKEIISIDDNLRQCYCVIDDEGQITYFKYLYQSPLDIDGSVITSGLPIEYAIRYFGTYYAYVTDTNDPWCYWTNDIVENPASLNFWFDFMDANSEMGQYSTIAIGDRTKVVNDSKVTSIYFRQVPELIFTTKKEWEKYDQADSGYTVVFVTGGLENMFKISSQGQSAKDKLDELLYNYTYCIENITLQSVPVYYLQPNTRIYVRDDSTKINGEYIVSKITLPLAYNGTMSITATKAPENTRIN